LERVRYLSYAILHWLGVAFTTDFRPRYSPADVILTLQSRSEVHTSVQTAIAGEREGWIELIPLADGCYPVVNGFLCCA
jgi:hypothetical protein